MSYPPEVVQPDPVFKKWPKIYHLYRPVIITEKIDGTNAAVGVMPDGRVYAQSRKRVLTLTEDNHGFARWVNENQYELREALGEGLHFGEWYGCGIGKRYKFPHEKQLALFNVKRWTADALPDGVTTVPVLYEGTFSDSALRMVLNKLRETYGSGELSPSGAMNPEGVVVYFVQANTSFKVTLENDAMSKGEARAYGLEEQSV